jgi:hypothetical protein
MALNDPQPLDLTGLMADTDLAETVDALQTDFEQQHFGSTGAHGDVTLDSLSARTYGAKLPITGILQFLGGGWLLDREGNNDHVAGLRPEDWTGDQHNYNPPGLPAALMIEISTDAARSITGIARGTRHKRLLIFGNRGNYNVTLEHDHASSTSTNRFGLPGNLDIVLSSSEYIWLYYDVGSEIWRAVSSI